MRCAAGLITAHGEWGPKNQDTVAHSLQSEFLASKGVTQDLFSCTLLPGTWDPSFPFGTGSPEVTPESLGVICPPAVGEGTVLLWLVLLPLPRDRHPNMSPGSLLLGSVLGIHRKEEVSGLIALFWWLGLATPCR